MRPSLSLLPALLLAAAPALAQVDDPAPPAQTAGGAGTTSAPDEIALADLSIDEMKDAPVFAADGVEIGRVSSVIPAEDDISSILVDVSTLVGTGEASLAFRPEDFSARRDSDGGKVRLVSTMDSETITALAASSN